MIKMFPLKMTTLEKSKLHKKANNNPSFKKQHEKNEE